MRPKPFYFVINKTLIKQFTIRNVWFLFLVRVLPPHRPSTIASIAVWTQNVLSVISPTHTLQLLWLDSITQYSVSLYIGSWCSVQAYVTWQVPVWQECAGWQVFSPNPRWPWGHVHSQWWPDLDRPGSLVRPQRVLDFCDRCSHQVCCTQWAEEIIQENISLIIEAQGMTGNIFYYTVQCWEGYF